MSNKPVNLPDFTLSESPVSHHGIEHWLYTSVAGTNPVLLLHELPGLIPECVRLGRDLANEGFKVYMPLLFGEAGQRDRLAFLRICWNREFHACARRKTSPVVNWLRHVIDRISQQNGGTNVGVIGMCLTGNFALTLIAHPSVNGAVCCQPSLPLMRTDKFFAMDEADYQASIDAAKQLGESCILGARYKRDPFSSKKQWGWITDAYGASMKVVEPEGRKHATLTLDRNEEAFGRVVAHLRYRIGA
jgi:dienelactone hydrolase